MAYTRKKALIVDGYNVIRSGRRYQGIDDPDYTDDELNRAREALINDVVSYAGKDYEATIVFDGGGNEFSTGEPTKVGGVTIIFSPSGSSADKVIEKLAHQARERGVEVLVVTSDAAVQDTVFGGGVGRMSSNDFSFEMEVYEHEAVMDEGPKIARKNTVAGRLDAETLAQLAALAKELD